jgi:hypothetical protein
MKRLYAFIPSFVLTLCLLYITGCDPLNWSSDTLEMRSNLQLTDRLNPFPRSIKWEGMSGTQIVFEKDGTITAYNPSAKTIAIRVTSAGEVPHIRTSPLNSKEVQQVTTREFDKKTGYWTTFTDTQKEGRLYSSLSFDKISGERSQSYQGLVQLRYSLGGKDVGTVMIHAEKLRQIGPPLDILFPWWSFWCAMKDKPIVDDFKIDTDSPFFPKYRFDTLHYSIFQDGKEVKPSISTSELYIQGISKVQILGVVK